MIPVCVPLVGERERALVAECLQEGWISSTGPWIGRFEEGFKALCGREHAIAVSNGTAALEVAVRALGVGPGDEVIVPSFTIISCALAVLSAGATPVFVDVDADDWMLTVDAVEQARSERTRAVMAVHMYGEIAPLAELLAWADRHGIALIEDAAQAHGAEVRTAGGALAPAGSQGAVSCFSFYANKLITTGEGGIVVTDDPDLAARAARARNLDFLPERRFWHEAIGGNFRLTSLQAALGIAQLDTVPERVATKRAMGKVYREALAELPGLQLQTTSRHGEGYPWMFGLVLEDRRGPATVLAAQLAERGVQTRPFFTGLHEQPALRDRHRAVGSFDVTERLGRQGLYLPSGLGLTADEQAQVIDAVVASWSTL
jgi:perosamine synthetase